MRIWTMHQSGCAHFLSISCCPKVGLRGIRVSLHIIQYSIWYRLGFLLCPYQSSLRFFVHINRHCDCFGFTVFLRFWNQPINIEMRANSKANSWNVLLWIINVVSFLSVPLSTGLSLATTRYALECAHLYLFTMQIMSSFHCHSLKFRSMRNC